MINVWSIKMKKYKLSREEECCRCNGAGSFYEEETCSNGAGYTVCHYCDGTGKIDSNISLNKKEIMELYNRMKKEKGDNSID